MGQQQSRYTEEQQHKLATIPFLKHWKEPFDVLLDKKHLIKEHFDTRELSRLLLDHLNMDHQLLSVMDGYLLDFLLDLALKHLFEPFVFECPSKLMPKSVFWYLTKNYKPRLVYSAARDGLGFSSILSRIERCQSSLLVIETMNGNKFGGFNSQPFKKSPKFTGDKNCFIFQLDPFQVFYPTNINQNYVYFQHSSKTLLNGIGFGGQMDFFCFFFDPDFKGHCRGQTTFDNPIFEPEFQVKDLEIWMTEERDQEEIDRHQDKREAMALLEMAGKTMYSKDVQD